jgi:hypothetical protein
MRSLAPAGAWILLFAIPAVAATPDQLYRTWEKNNHQQPQQAAQAAQDYLRAAPQGKYAHDLQIWLDAYRKALASLGLTESQVATANALNKKHRAAPRPAPPVQTAAQPPAQPEVQPFADKSLEETLNFIGDRVAGQGAIGFTARFHNSTGKHDLVEQLSYEASNVSIDTKKCSVSFHWHVERNGEPTPDEDRVVELDGPRSIRVETIDRALSNVNAAARNFSVRVHPQVYAVHIAAKDAPSGDHLFFHDRDSATQVGQAARHALELCGAGAGIPPPAQGQ